MKGHFSSDHMQSKPGGMAVNTDKERILESVQIDQVFLITVELSWVSNPGPGSCRFSVLPGREVPLHLESQVWILLLKGGFVQL